MWEFEPVEPGEKFLGSAVMDTLEIWEQVTVVVPFDVGCKSRCKHWGVLSRSFHDVDTCGVPFDPK